jgi:hypothetical protein
MACPQWHCRAWARAWSNPVQMAALRSDCREIVLGMGFLCAHSGLPDAVDAIRPLFDHEQVRGQEQMFAPVSDGTYSSRLPTASDPASAQSAR